ncbi:hypothetical protein [Prauserella halophila]|uniref:hypothetical protein n=1 Tax=Prauserella halophila TaxID=185641 RepID=UPI0020A26F0D|nr:hypothetical protein [Prauserella halophila]
MGIRKAAAHMMDGMMGMGWLWMALWGLAALAVLALAVFVGARFLGNLAAGRNGSEIDGAEQEVRRLYAAGQIDREVYLQRLDDLRHR